VAAECVWFAIEATAKPSPQRFVCLATHCFILDVVVSIYLLWLIIIICLKNILHLSTITMHSRFSQS
jgi:hypothetical protein